MVQGVGSSAQFQAASLAAFQLAGGAGGGAGHYTAKNAGEIIDTRPGPIVPELGNLSVVWNGAQTQVWTYLSVDLVVGNRAYFAQPRTTLQLVAPLPPDGQLIAAALWGADAATIPAAVVALLEPGGVNQPFTAAFTDILPADAKFAQNRVNCVASPATLGCLGYGTANPNIGTTILSAFSTAQAHPVNFNIFGTDPITGNAIPNYTVVPVGVSPIVILANRTNAAGLGQVALFSNVNAQATAQLLWTGTDCAGTAFGPYDAAHSFAINPIQREPMSGTMNTFEFNIMVQNLQGSTANGYFSQEGVLSSPYFIPSDFSAINPATNNPLNGGCPGGNPYASVPQGNRMRAIGTGEMVSAVKATKDSLGYIFFVYGNVSSIAGNPSYGYLTYEQSLVGGVLVPTDPINPSGSYTTAYSAGGLNYPGNGQLPTCTVPCSIPPGASFPNIRNGAYRAWSVLRAVADAGSLSLTNLQALATVEANQINSTEPDFLPFNPAADGDPGFLGYRSHFDPSGGAGAMIGTPPFVFNLGNVPNNGITVPTAEAGGDVGGCLQYKTSPNLLNCRY
jgi:hypothetical protein